MNVSQDKLLEAVCGNARSFDAIVSSIEVRGVAGREQAARTVSLIDLVLLLLSSSSQTQCQASLNGAVIDRRKRRNTAGERAAKKLTEEHRLEQLEEEERVKRQKRSLDGETVSPPKTLAQQRVLEKLRAARVGVTPEQSLKAVAVATPEEYAEWRAQALEFMRNKKERVDQLAVVTSSS
ncbi:hypothetical protein ON010_g16689 [Phytophthora cinnamomi]|nr:hypothetical protein ON010_g16689 [Phytophthora cinnamomi]